MIQFFKNDSDCAFDPRYFTNDHECKNFVPDNLRRRINHQISHMLAERTADGPEKLGPDDRTKVLELIEKEIARWVAALDPLYKSDWLAPPKQQYVIANPVNSATNAFQSSATHTATIEGGPIYKIDRFKKLETVMSRR